MLCLLCLFQGAARFSIKIGQSDGLVGIVAAGPSGNCLQYDAINSRFTMQPASNTCNTLTLRPVAGVLTAVTCSLCVLIALLCCVLQQFWSGS